jgi:hypothetical protein
MVDISLINWTNIEFVIKLNQQIFLTISLILISYK